MEDGVVFTLLATEDLEGVWGSSICRLSPKSGATAEESTEAVDGGFTEGGGITNSPPPGRK